MTACCASGIPDHLPHINNNISLHYNIHVSTPIYNVRNNRTDVIIEKFVVNDNMVLYIKSVYESTMDVVIVQRIQYVLQYIFVIFYKFNKINC